MKTCYIHLRPGLTYDQETHKLVGEPSSKGGTTIAFKADDPKEYDTCHCYLAIAQCSPRDAYSRSRGRAISTGRLSRGPVVIFTIDQSRPLPEQVIEQAAILVEAL